MKNQAQGSDKQRKVQATILSGIQPTNQITLGNYLGALKNWVKFSELKTDFLLPFLKKMRKIKPVARAGAHRFMTLL